jgi:hypothetical protein
MTDLQAAKARLAGARDLWRILGDRLHHMDEIARSRRLEHDEMIQLAHSRRSASIARDRAWDDVQGWRRIVNQLSGQSAPGRSIGPGRGAIRLGR